jgi:hypothetical protein
VRANIRVGEDPSTLDDHLFANGTWWQRFPTLTRALLFSAIGLAIQEIGYQIARSGSHDVPAQILFFVGLTIEYLSCTSVLVLPEIPRLERVGAGVLLGEVLFVSQWLPHPLLFSRYDELLNLTSLLHLVDGRHFFTPNTLLPVSPYYPGLQLVTAGVHWMSGLSGLLSEIVVVVGARALLIASLFLVVERIFRSERVAGLAIAIYIANPQFYTFDAQYAYETLALAFAVTTLYYAFRAIDQPEASKRYLGAAACVLALLDVTHHVTSWAELLALAAAAIWLSIVGKRAAARIFFLLACLDAIIVAGWTTFVGGKIVHYIGPLIHEAVDSVGDILLRRTRAQTFFIQPTGVRTPGWEQGVIWVSVIVWAVLILTATLSKRGRRYLRGNPALWLIAMGSAGYFVVLALHVSASAAQFGERASSLVFFFVACSVAIWWIRSGGFDRPLLFALSLIVLAALMMGGILLGSGPDYQRVPGPYLVEADQRSIDFNSLAAANWAKEHLPPSTRIAADRDNAALMAAVGGLTPVTWLGGSVDVSPLYFAKQLGESQDELVRKGRIRLLLVDDRLAESLPFVGEYFESVPNYNPATGISHLQRLTREELSKFSNWPGSSVIYHHGPITIYDVSRIEGLPPIMVRSHEQSEELTQTNWPTLASIMALLLYLIITKRRSKIPISDKASKIVDSSFGATIFFFLFGVVLVASGLNSAAVAIPVAASIGLVLTLKGRSFRSPAIPLWLTKSTVLLGLSAFLLLLGTVLTAIETAVR